MKNDLISRDAIIKSIQNKLNEFDFDTEYNEGLRDGYLNAIYAIEDAPTVEEKPFEINVFLENADESTLFDIKKELARILTERAEKEAYEEARREAMRLDDNEDSLKWRFTH